MAEFIFEVSGEKYVLFSSRKGPETWENVILADDGETVFVGHQNWEVIASFLVRGLLVTHFDSDNKFVDEVSFDKRTDRHTFNVASGVVAQLADF